MEKTQLTAWFNYNSVNNVCYIQRGIYSKRFTGG